jgi:hypothetical protein
MKKTLLFAIPVLLVIFLMSFTINTAPVEQPANAHVKMHITGCDNCKDFSYCIDGGPTVFVGSCDFDFYVEAGDHTMCLLCGGSGFNYQFSIKEGASIKLDVSIPSLTGPCSCDGTKKNKK